MHPVELIERMPPTTTRLDLNLREKLNPNNPCKRQTAVLRELLYPMETKTNKDWKQTIFFGQLLTQPKN